MIHVKQKYGGVVIGSIPLVIGPNGHWIKALVAALGADDSQLGLMWENGKNGALGTGSGAVDSTVDQTYELIIQADSVDDIIEGDFISLPEGGLTLEIVTNP